MGARAGCGRHVLILGARDALEAVVAEGVTVLLEEALRVVVDDAGKVGDAKGRVPARLGLAVVRVLAVLAMQLLQQRVVRPCVHVRALRC